MAHSFSTENLQQGGLDASASSAHRVATFAFQVSEWKRPILQSYFPERLFQFAPPGVNDRDLARVDTPVIGAKPCELFVWGDAPGNLVAFAKAHDIPLWFIEDGFIRSTRPSASRTAPFSWALDRRAPYFDCRQASDLEQILKTYDFDGDARLMARARAGIRFLLDQGISKYNEGSQQNAEQIYGLKNRKRVLVVGQVEDDASIRYGCLAQLDNNDLVRLAAQEQPDAQVLYKPHPDVLSRVRQAQSDAAEVAHLCQIITERLPLAEALRTVDHVYTITSLAGFEALLRGIKVTTLGCPFYSGWGLTDDRQPNPRRGRALSVEALFAGAYLIYPRYFDPETGKQTSCEETVAAIMAELAKPRMMLSGPEWRLWGPYGILGWRHLLTRIVSPIIRRIGNDRDVEDFRANPIRFFRGLSDRRLRLVGRILYPFG